MLKVLLNESRFSVSKKYDVVETGFIGHFCRTQIHCVDWGPNECKMHCYASSGCELCKLQVPGASCKFKVQVPYPSFESLSTSPES